MAEVQPWEQPSDLYRQCDVAEAGQQECVRPGEGAARADSSAADCNGSRGEALRSNVCDVPRELRLPSPHIPWATNAKGRLMPVLLAPTHGHDAAPFNPAVLVDAHG